MRNAADEIRGEHMTVGLRDREAEERAIHHKGLHSIGFTETPLAKYTARENMEALQRGDVCGT